MGFGFGVWGLKFGVWSLGFRVSGLGFGVSNFVSWVLGLWCGVSSFGFGVSSLGFGVWGLGFRVGGLPYLADIFSHCVPFPDAGDPTTITCHPAAFFSGVCTRGKVVRSRLLKSL